MKYGFVLPSGDARIAADFAHDAEQAGWDGFFVWEAAWSVDAWVSLTAAAMRTERIRLGTDLTPAPFTPVDDSSAGMLEDFTGGEMGAAGTLAATSVLTRMLKRLSLFGEVG